MGDLINIGVTIVEVRSLATWKVPVISKSDVYTAVKVSAQQNKTKTIQTAKSYAMWNETFHYVVSPDDRIEMEVRSRRFFGHELFGKLQVPAGIVFDEGPFEGWFPITRTGKNRGEIFIRIHYIPCPDAVIFS